MRRLTKLRSISLLSAFLAFIPIPTAVADPAADAQARYEHAVDLYTRGAYADALLELLSVRELNRSPKVLYNIAQVKFAMNDFVGAVAAYRQYLDEAGDTLLPDRRAHVQTEISALEARLAHVTVEADVSGAVVFLQGAKLGPAPVTSVINPGTHEFRVEHELYPQQTKQVTAPEGGRERVVFQLVVPIRPAAPYGTDSQRARGSALPPIVPARRRSQSAAMLDVGRRNAWLVAGGLGVVAIPLGAGAWAVQHRDATAARVLAGACDAAWSSAGLLALWLVFDPSAFSSREAEPTGAAGWSLQASPSSVALSGRF